MRSDPSHGPPPRFAPPRERARPTTGTGCFAQVFGIDETLVEQAPSAAMKSLRGATSSPCAQVERLRDRLCVTDGHPQSGAWPSGCRATGPRHGQPTARAGGRLRRRRCSGASVVSRNWSASISSAAAARSTASRAPSLPLASEKSDTSTPILPGSRPLIGMTGHRTAVTAMPSCQQHANKVIDHVASPSGGWAGLDAGLPHIGNVARRAREVR